MTIYIWGVDPPLVVVDIARAVGKQYSGFPSVYMNTIPRKKANKKKPFTLNYRKAGGERYWLITAIIGYYSFEPPTLLCAMNYDLLPGQMFYNNDMVVGFTSGQSD